VQHGICLLSVIGARKEPSGTSEMVTQLLFGEIYTITETTEDWLKVITDFDQYECWISSKQHSKISFATFDKLKKSSPVFCKEFIYSIKNQQTQLSFPITLGASLPFFQNQIIGFDSQLFDFDGKVYSGSEKMSATDIIATANTLLNAPYLWGGKSPLGIDCSGFTQTVFKVNGYKLPRDANQQVELGTALSFVEEAEPGDLAFFDNEEGRITHVGILLNNEQIIHASGYVKIEKFDHYGIYSNNLRKYSHTLRVIKRIL
jgi:gamma-D-glutamyl-L-lysine dipeptidyl-peptidase